MNQVKKVLIASSLVLATGAGIVLAVLSPSTATLSSTAQLSKTGSDSTRAKEKRQSYANPKASGQVDSVEASGQAIIQSGLAKINFNAPIVVTPPPTTVGGKVSSPITCKSNTTYSGLTIDMNGLNNQAAINISGCTNVHITNCKVINAKNFAVLIQNSQNITIDYNFFNNVGFGVWAVNGTLNTIKINYNQFLNINGIDTKSLGHAIQFSSVQGGGSSISYNRIENIQGKALHPHDQISLYTSNGKIGDSIMVVGNWIRGGQVFFWPGTTGGASGACGIGFGDNGGTYQVVRGNILVNPGYIGIQAAGGSHLRADHNKIYSASWGVSGAGMVWQNLTGKPSTDVIYSYNQIKFLNAQGSEVDFNNKGNCTSIGNLMTAKIDASILPATIITMK